jgi:peptide chain release factor 3
MPLSATRIPLLGAVGPLQFEVVQFRLITEYNAECQIESAPYTVLRWIKAPEEVVVPEGIMLGSGTMLAQDMENRWVLLCGDPWALRYFEQRNPGVELAELPFKG